MKLPFAAETFADVRLIRAQEAVRRVTDAVKETMPSRITVTFTAGQAVTFAHRLGVQPTKWTTVDVIGGYGSFQRTAWDASTLTVQSQNACTAVFEVV